MKPAINSQQASRKVDSSQALTKVRNVKKKVSPSSYYSGNSGGDELADSMRENSN